MTKVIAIVDDEREMEYIYDMILEDLIKDSKIDLKFFSDSRNYLSWIKNNSADLIMMDINMPYYNGIELAQLTRSFGRNIPTYWISGEEEQSFKKQMAQNKIQRFLSKPVDFNQALNLIGEDLNIQFPNM
jgi:two-component system, response regulator YesN